MCLSSRLTANLTCNEGKFGQGILICKAYLFVAATTAIKIFDLGSNMLHFSLQTFVIGPSNFFQYESINILTESNLEVNWLKIQNHSLRNAVFL